jgi:hypothetical protein
MYYFLTAIINESIEDRCKTDFNSPFKLLAPVSLKSPSILKLTLKRIKLSHGKVFFFSI